MKTKLYLIAARMNDGEGDIFAIATSKLGAQITMLEILREDAISAHEEPPSEDMLEEYIRLEYTIDEPIELPLHSDAGKLAAYKIVLEV